MEECEIPHQWSIQTRHMNIQHTLPPLSKFKPTPHNLHNDYIDMSHRHDNPLARSSHIRIQQCFVIVLHEFHCWGVSGNQIPNEVVHGIYIILSILEGFIYLFI